VELSKSGRLNGLLFDAIVALAFGSVLIPGAHGVSLIGYWLWMIGPEDARSLIGWLGIILLMVKAKISRPGLYLSLTMAGLTMLVVSWWLFTFIRLWEELIPSIPFLGLVVGRITHLIVQQRGRIE
jgi:hypothetical protein